MVAKAEEYRGEARRLQKRAEATVDEQIRLSLLSMARRWLDIANDIERYEVDQGFKAALPPQASMASRLECC
jgi:hypothetical protein